MAYQVLARKWRPQSFEQIRGQGHIARALGNAISSGRIAHAYLFTGIRGVGKTSAARVLAKALNCADGPTATPCNQCDACREITDGRSADVLEIDGASNTGVEDVRRLREAVRYPPVRGPYRVYIIDEVHMLSTAAFNALLKTLEEPPEHVIFVFATTDAHKIPVTILSRCQQFDFKRLSPRELGLLLGEVAAAEGVAVDERSLAALAREADGSVRDGQSLLDQVISYAGSEVRYEDVRDVLGVVDRELLLRVARAVVQRDPRGVLAALGEAEQFGYDVRRFSLDLLDVFRDLAVLRGVADAGDLVDLTAEEAAEAGEFCGEAGWEDLHALFDMLGRGVEHLRIASRPAVVLEMTLLKMAKLPPLLPLAEVLARAETARLPSAAAAGVQSPPAAPVPPAAQPDPVAEVATGGDPEADAPAGPRPEPAAPAALAEPEAEARPAQPAAAAQPVTDRAALWAELLAWTEARNRPVWSVLSSHAGLAAWDPGAGLAEIQYDDPSHEFFLRGKQDLLAEFFSGHRTGSGPVRLEFTCLGRRCNPNPAGDDSDRVRSLKKEGFEHPLVRQAVDVFDGDIEEVKVLKP